MSNDPVPLVSISCLTYNHENYIQNAIESFFIQKTNFLFEILIHDDASIDNTTKIIRKYETTFPDIIKPIYQIKNIFSKLDGTIFKIQICRARGKYLALCEGDDFWIDPLKLQKQVNFLDANLEYALVATDVILIDNAGNQISDNEMIVKQKTFNRSDITFFDLLQANLVNTPTVVVRTDLMYELATEIITRNLSFVMDKWFWLNIAMNHKIKLLEEKTAAYRVHPAGISRNSEYMDSRMPQIKHYMIRKYILNHNLYTLNEADLTILSKSCLNLILFKNLNLKKRLDILWLVFTHPVLLKNSMNFTAERIRKRFRRI
jgi:glycosyltransferase involved in cell wall biosynthesis